MKIDNGKQTESFFQFLAADWKQLEKISGLSRPFSWVRIVHPRFMHIFLVRVVLSLQKSGLSRIARLFSIILYFIYRIELNTKIKIGPGLVIPHPMGIVLGAHFIGGRALIYQNVTLGAKYPDVKYDETKRPRIGDDVIIGSGAVVVGGLKVGNKSIIAANSLVISDVDDNLTVIGVPAIIAKKRTNSG